MNTASSEVDLVQRLLQFQQDAPVGPERAMVEILGGVESTALMEPAALPRAVFTEIPEVLRFGKDNSLGLKVAASEADRLTCWHLVYTEYLALGYTRPQELEYRYSIHDALPNTATFLVQNGDCPAGTVSVFPDSPVGLPADEIFRAELEALRAAGRQPVEIGRLTIAKAFVNDRALLTSLFDILSIHARCIRHATDLVITVNPAHAKFYEKMLLFERMGATRDLGSVCGAPAVLMRLDLERQRQVIRWTHGEGPRPAGPEPGRTFYGYFSTRAGEKRRVAWLRRHLRPMDESFILRYFVEFRPLIPALLSPLRYFFEKCYPRCFAPAAGMPGGAN